MKIAFPLPANHLVSSAVVLAALAVPASAETRNWISASSTNLNGASNWSGGVVPALTDEVVFTNVPQSVLSTGNTLNWGRLVWNSTSGRTIRISDNQTGNKVLNLGGNTDSTAALAAGGTADDLIVIASGSGTLTVSNEGSSGTTNRLIVQVQKSGNINVIDADSVLIHTAELRGDYALTKTGLGTLTLGYNGALGGSHTFTIAAGTVNANHTQSLGVGNVLVSGGTLTINEGVEGQINLASGKNFTLTGGTLQFTLSSAVSYDRINGQGSGVFSLTNGTIDFGNSIADYSVSYTLFNGFASGSVNGITFINYDPAYTPQLGANGVLTFAPATIPEPSTYAAIIGACGLALAALRRRRS